MVSDVHRCVRGTAWLAMSLSCVIALSGILFGGCGSSSELSSSWNNNTVIVDGSAGEWGAELSSLKDSRVSVGIRNDRDYLYLCVMSGDPQVRRQILGLGLTVWFESENGGKIGVQYPIGMIQQRALGLPGIEANRDPEERDRMVDQSLLDLEILGPEKEDRNLFSTTQVPGLNVKLGGREGSVIYELRIPLAKTKDHAYAIGADPGSVLNIAIRTGKLEGVARQGSEPGGGMRGGRRRGGGGPPREGLPPGDGRYGTRGSVGRPEPLDYSAHVRLARQESQK